MVYTVGTRTVFYYYYCIGRLSGASSVKWLPRKAEQHLTAQECVPMLQVTVDFTAFGVMAGGSHDLHWHVTSGFGDVSSSGAVHFKQAVRFNTTSVLNMSVTVMKYLWRSGEI